MNIVIADPEHRRFPFPKTFFHDSTVLYHGTCSTWASSIRSQGFTVQGFPFDWRDVAVVCDARKAVAAGSMLQVFLGDRYPHEPPRRSVFFSANYWFARAYATDRGGEVVRKTLEEAEDFEHLCADAERRERAVRYWKEGLRQHPNHAPTKEVIRMLQSDGALQALLQRVQEARTRLTRGIDGGHPVVLAVRVDPGWFSAKWRFHLDQWDIGMKEVNMRCEVQTIAPECILASVEYPNGTDPNFLPTGEEWDEIKELLA
jgi:hypothetical protein